MISANAQKRKKQQTYNSGFVQAARPLNANASQPDTKPSTVSLVFCLPIFQHFL